MNQVTSPDAPSAIGPYSQAIIEGKLVFLSGQIPIDPKTGNIVKGGIAEQTEQVMCNLNAVLQQAGTGFEKVVKTLCFLRSMDDFGIFNEIYGKYFVGKPVRSCVAVSALPKGALVEVEVIAVM